MTIAWNRAGDTWTAEARGLYLTVWRAGGSQPFVWECSTSREAHVPPIEAGDVDTLEEAQAAAEGIAERCAGEARRGAA